MAATWATLGGINLLWPRMIWSNNQFDQNSDQMTKEISVVSWENTFYQACETDCEAPGGTTGISIQSRWKDEVWFLCVCVCVCIIIITAPENTRWEVSVCSLLGDLPCRLFNTRGTTKAHCTKATNMKYWWRKYCEGLLFPLVENGVSAPTGITISMFIIINPNYKHNKEKNLQCSC